jgi:hypothetical protein
MKLFPRVIRQQVPLRVPVELHQLVTDLQDAMQHLIQLAPSATPEEREAYLDAYAAYSQRRRELYEYVIERTPRTREYNAIYINF